MGYIYKITNTENGRSYIGQTRRSLKERFDQHIRDSLRCDYKVSRAIRKYGRDNFIIEDLEEVDDSELNSREIYWIAYFDTYHNGYNSTPGGNCIIEIDDEMIIRKWEEGMSIPEIAEATGYCNATVASHLKNNFSLYSSRESMHRGKRNQMHAVNQYDLFGNFIDSFDSTASAAEKYGVDRTLISACCRKKRWSGVGYQWRYVDDDPPGAYINEQSNKKPVRQYDLTGVFIAEYESVSNAATTSGANKTTIAACCNGKSQSAGGYIWRYVGDDTPIMPVRPRTRSVIQYDIENNYISEYKSVTEASCETNISISSICNACTARTKTAGGYIWKFKETA